MIYQLLISLTAAQLSSLSGRCTYHPYEEDFYRIGADIDNSPGWCGIRYSMLNVARIVAVNGLESKDCVQCLEVSSARGGPKTYILAVDRKADPGLDVAKSSYEAMFPGQNPLDPQLCQWKVVPYQRCGGVCVGGEEECSTGKRNLLPAYLLPKYPAAKIGVERGNGRSEGSSNANPGLAVTTVNANRPEPTNSPRRASTNTPRSSNSTISKSSTTQLQTTTTTYEVTSTTAVYSALATEVSTRGEISNPKTYDHNEKVPNLYGYISSGKAVELCSWLVAIVLVL